MSNMAYRLLRRPLISEIIVLSLARAVEGHRILWKIDYYDPTLSWHSEDSADSAKTRRVLTVMLSHEY